MHQRPARLATRLAVVLALVGLLAPAAAVVADTAPADPVVSGRVTDERGRPVAGVRVGVGSFVGSGPPYDTFGVPTVATDADGRYVIRDITAGVHRFVFSADDDVHVDRLWPRARPDRASGAVDVVVETGEGVTVVDAVLPVGGAVAGGLALPEGERPYYRYAALYRGDARAWSLVEERQIYGDVDHFVVGGVPSGTYRLCFAQAAGARPTACLGGSHLDTATPVTVTAGSVTRRDFAAPAPGRIDGHVVVETVPAGQEMSAGDVVVGVLRLTPRGYENAGGDDADSYGYFSIDHLPPGRYRLSYRYEGDQLAGTQEFWPDAGSVEEGIDILVGPGTRTTVDAFLEAGAQISGRFLDDDGDGHRDRVTAYRRAPDGQWRPVTTGEVPVDGGYRVTGLRPGTYRLGFGADPQWFASSIPVFWPASPTLAGASDIVVRSVEDRVEGIDVDVDPGSVISGAALGFGRHVISAGDVVAYRRVGGRWVEERRDRPAWRLDGHYALAGLPAGTYRVSFEHDAGFWAPGFHGGGGPRRLSEAADVVLAADAHVAGVDIVLAGLVRNPVPGRVLGKARVGAVLRLRTGTWSPTGTVLQHRWYVGDRARRGVTGTTYRVRPRDRGERISVVTTGRRGAGWYPLRTRTPRTAPVTARRPG
jgi:hypothetical protein